MKAKKLISMALAAFLGLQPLMITASAEADFVGGPYADVNNKTVVANIDNCVLETVTFEGKKALKVTPNPDTEAKGEIALDSYNITSKYKATYEDYHYISVDYYYDTDAPTFKGKFRINLNNSNKVFIKAVPALYDTETIVTRQWATAYYEVGTYTEGNLTEDMAEHPIKHISVRPFDGTDAKALKSSDVIYIGDIRFYKDNPAPGRLATYVPGGASAPSAPSAPSSGTTAPAVLAEDDHVRNEGNSASVTESHDDDIVVDYSSVNPYYHDKQNPGVLTVGDTVDGRSALTIRLDNKSQDSMISLETNFSKLPVVPSLDDGYRFISVEYKLITASSASYNMGIYIKGTPKIFASGGKNLTSQNKLRAGEWDIAYFIIPEDWLADLNPEVTPHNLSNMHFRPLGISTKPNSTADGDIICIGSVTFSKENPNPKTSVLVSFDKAFSAVVGSVPAPVTVKLGESCILPAPELTLEGSTFAGWVRAGDGNVYKPGDSFLCTGEDDVIFQAKWNEVGSMANAFSASFPEVFSEICDKKDTAFAEKTVLDGLNVVRAVPNTASENDIAIILDTFGFNSKCKVDLDFYKYMAVLYKYESDAPSFTGDIKVNFTRNSGMFTTGPSLVPINAKAVTNRWAVATFEIPELADRYTDPAGSHLLKQFHIYPFGGLKTSELQSTDVFNAATVLFFPEKPNVGYHTAYIKGYSDGSFGPNKTMTRAEACTIVARLFAGGDANIEEAASAFTDVLPGEWYTKYIALCESCGFLSSYSGAFLPNQNITRAEFVELVYNMGLLEGGDIERSFTDVDASHPRYSVISAAARSGLVGGYKNEDGVSYSFKPDNTITRAEVVKVINNAYGKVLTRDSITSEYNSKFTDVDDTFWAYADIIDASVDHLGFVDGDHEVWLKTTGEEVYDTEPYNVDTAAGAARIAELDAEFASRAAAIRATPTAVTVSGTSYYVSSSSGNDANPGTSPDAPLASFDGVKRLALKSGDGVFFRRGDTFRGVSYQCVRGVTYSAYGEGAKPEIWGSERNYADASLWETTGVPNVYKLNVPITNDVGLIVFNGGEAYTQKRIKGRSDFVSGNLADLDCDLALWHDVSAPTGVSGFVYLRSDLGNPGDRFTDIELAARANIFRATDGNTFDNLSLKYTGAHAIGAGTVSSFTVQNCEIGWIGGSWFRTDTLSRYGNGIEVYGGCENYLVHNNYLYQIYDAGITHQYSNADSNIIMKNIEYSDNLVEYASYSFEYFNAAPETGFRHSIENCHFVNNFLRLGGYGFGDQRPDKTAAALIKGWDHWNEASDYTVENNIFDRCKYMLLHIGASYSAWLPVMSGNTYVQTLGGDFGKFGTKHPAFDAKLSGIIENVLKDETASVFFAPAQ